MLPRERFRPYVSFSPVVPDADIALAEGNAQAALDVLRKMGQSGVPLGGLHDIERRESVARALRMLGRFDEAVAELETLLAIYGSHAVAHYQLGLVYQDMGRTGEAEQSYNAFLDAWSQADAGLPRVTDARRRLQELRGS